LAFVFLPGIFYVRYHRLPFVVPLIPKNKYDIVEYLYAHLHLLFTIFIFIWPLTTTWHPFLGSILFFLGCALQVWSVISFGASWRIGQDRNDTDCEFVCKGPFRIMSHPIYVSLVFIAFGQAMLMGIEWRSAILVLGTLAYIFVQANAETKYWKRKQK